MKKILFPLLLAVGLAHAADPTYHITLDTHHTGDKWKIDNLYIGDTPVMRFHLRENGAAWTATTNYSATFWYGTDGLDSTSTVSETGTGTGATYIDIATDAQTFASNGTYTCGLTVTNSAGTYTKTWGDGKLVVKKSPGAGSASALSLVSTLPLDQMAVTGTIPDANIPATITRDSEWDSVAEIEAATGADFLLAGEGGSGDLVAASNLLDLASIPAARTNLGLVAGGAGDVWVEKAGDTMTGNLDMGTNELENVSIITVTDSASIPDLYDLGKIWGGFDVGGNVDMEGNTVSNAVFAGDGASVTNVNAATVDGVEGASIVTNRYVAYAFSDLTTAITAAPNKGVFRMPFAMTADEVRVSLNVAPTGSVFTVDINESGSSILSTKITVDATEETSTTAATPAVISDSALADDAEITIDVDSVGAAYGGAGGVVYIIETN